MDENQNKPEETLPPKELQQIPPSQPISSSTTQPQQPMEVHHHGHVHENKKWKEYVFQFIMLFLAVFLGFWSETLREKSVERSMEREYMESLMKDTRNDSLIADGLSTDIYTQISGIDSLQTIFSDESTWSPRVRDSMVRQCYKLTKYIRTFYPIFFNENTINQLLGSGSMRLVKKDGVAEEIMTYHAYIKFVEVQKQLYVTSVSDCGQTMYNIYNVDYLRTKMVDGVLQGQLIDSVQGITLLPIDNAQLTRFNAALESTKLIAATYQGYLIDLKERAGELYRYLSKKYGIIHHKTE
jgi:hypothetical protein